MDVWKRSSAIYDCFFLIFGKFVQRIWDFFPHFRTMQCPMKKGGSLRTRPLGGVTFHRCQSKARRLMSVKRASALLPRQVFMIVTVVKVMSASSAKTGI